MQLSASQRSILQRDKHLVFQLTHVVDGFSVLHEMQVVRIKMLAQSSDYQCVIVTRMGMESVSQAPRLNKRTTWLKRDFVPSRPGLLDPAGNGGWEARSILGLNRDHRPNCVKRPFEWLNQPLATEDRKTDLGQWYG